MTTDRDTQPLLPAEIDAIEALAKEIIGADYADGFYFTDHQTIKVSVALALRLCAAARRGIGHQHLIRAAQAIRYAVENKQSIHTDAMAYLFESLDEIAALSAAQSEETK